MRTLLLGTCLLSSALTIACDRGEDTSPPAPPSPPPQPTEPEPTPNLPEVPDLSARDARETRMPLFSFDLAAFGSASSRWTLRVGDEVQHTETRTRAADGTLHISADGRDVYVREGALYRVERGRCQALAGTAIEQVVGGLGSVPVGGPIALAMGVVVDGVPRGSARRVGTDEGMEHWQVDWDVNEGVARRRVRAEVWLDSDGRVVRSRGTSEASALGEAMPTTGWEYEVTRVGEDAQVQLPDSCPDPRAATGAAAVPRIPGATVQMQSGQILSYTAPGEPSSAVAWYRRELGERGFTVDREQAQGSSTLMSFRKEGEQIMITVSEAAPGAVSVMVVSQ